MPVCKDQITTETEVESMIQLAMEIINKHKQSGCENPLKPDLICWSYLQRQREVLKNTQARFCHGRKWNFPQEQDCSSSEELKKNKTHFYQGV